DRTVPSRARIVDAHAGVVVADLARRTRPLARIGHALTELAALAQRAVHAGAARVAVARDAVLTGRARDGLARGHHPHAGDPVLIRGAALGERRAIVGRALAGRAVADQRRRARFRRADVDAHALVALLHVAVDRRAVDAEARIGDAVRVDADLPVRARELA